MSKRRTATPEPTVIDQAAAALESAVEIDINGRPVDVVPLRPLAELLAHAQALEQDCQRAEAIVKRAQADLKDARQDYEGNVAALRAYCADMRLPQLAPLPLIDHAHQADAATGADDTPF